MLSDAHELTLHMLLAEPAEPAPASRAASHTVPTCSAWFQPDSVHSIEQQLVLGPLEGSAASLSPQVRHTQPVHGHIAKTKCLAHERGRGICHAHSYLYKGCLMMVAGSLTAADAQLETCKLIVGSALRPGAAEVQRAAECPGGQVQGESQPQTALRGCSSQPAGSRAWAAAHLELPGRVGHHQLPGQHGTLGTDHEAIWLVQLQLQMVCCSQAGCMSSRSGHRVIESLARGLQHVMAHLIEILMACFRLCWIFHDSSEPEVGQVVWWV